MNALLKNIVAFTIFFIIAFLICYFNIIYTNSPEMTKKNDDMKNELSSINIMTGSSLFETNNYKKINSILITNTYTSHYSNDDIFRYYDEQLKKNNWIFNTKESSVTGGRGIHSKIDCYYYKKNNYYFDIGIILDNKSEWKYTLEITWGLTP